MTPSATLLLIYCGLVVAASVLGGQLPQWIRLTHLRTQLMMSGVGGLMLGVALMHLLPEAAWSLQSPSKMGAGALAGLIAMFLLIRLFPTHDHSNPGQPSSCQHVSDLEEEAHHHDEASRGITWLGLFVGLALHTVVDGVAIAASVLVEANHAGWSLVGFGTFLAVALHKPLDSFAITTLMKRQRWSATSQNFVNLAFSLSCPIGAAAFYFGSSTIGFGSGWLGWGLAMSGGFFIGIALADLLPEVAFHRHDRGILTAALLGGVALAVAIENLPGHDHDDRTRTELSIRGD